MKKLETHDLFVGMRLIKNAKVKESLAGMVGVKPNEQRAKGFELLADIIGNLGDTKAELTVYEFLSSPMEIPAEELKKMDALEFLDKVEELVEFIGIDEWRAFFARVLKLMK